MGIKLSAPITLEALSGTFTTNNRIPVVNGTNSLSESTLSFASDVLSTVSGFLGIGAGASQQGSETFGVNGEIYITSAGGDIQSGSSGLGIGNSAGIIAGYSSYFTLANQGAGAAPAIELIGNRASDGQISASIYGVNGAASSEAKIAAIDFVYGGSSGTGHIDISTSGTRALYVDKNQKVIIGTSTTPDGKLTVYQASASGAEAVATLSQSDVDEPFLKLIGTAAGASVTNSLVAVADVTSSTIAGFAKVEVQDDGNQMTDQDYYIPVYELT